MAPERLSPDEAFGLMADVDPTLLLSADAPSMPDHDGMTCPRPECGQPVPMGSLWLVAGLLYCSQECGRSGSIAAKAKNATLEIEAEVGPC